MAVVRPSLRREFAYSANSNIKFRVRNFIPKRLRVYFRFDRKLLKELPKVASDVIKTVYQTVLGRDDVSPGMVAAAQSFGELAHWHPHVHAIVTDGAFTSDGEFIPLPEMAVEPFLKLWERGVFKLLLKHGKITPETVVDMNSWKHSGFSVHKNVLIEAGDKVGLEGLTQYIARCPFSLDRIMKLGDRPRRLQGRAYQMPAISRTRRRTPKRRSQQKLPDIRPIGFSRRDNAAHSKPR